MKYISERSPGIGPGTNSVAVRFANFCATMVLFILISFFDNFNGIHIMEYGDVKNLFI